MQGISSWVAGIAAAVLILGAVSVVAPKNSAGRVCFVIGNILVLVALVSPLGQFDSMRLLDVGNEYYREVKESVSNAGLTSEKIKNKIIGENLSAYVLNKASVSEEACRVSMEISDGEVLSAKIISTDRASAKRVSMVLEQDLGIPSESQKIKVEGMEDEG